jgi:hypothetical protein
MLHYTCSSSSLVGDPSPFLYTWPTHQGLCRSGTYTPCHDMHKHLLSPYITVLLPLLRHTLLPHCLCRHWVAQ